MGKKKGKRKAGDARGYATSSSSAAASTTKPQLAKSSVKTTPRSEGKKRHEISEATTEVSQQQQPYKNPSVVRIDGSLEKSLVDMVKSDLDDAFQYLIADGVDRVTQRRLDELYTQLEKIGFSHSQISQGLTATLGSGLRAALDWLCLYCKHEDLPVILTDKATLEEAAVKIEIVDTKKSAVTKVASEHSDDDKKKNVVLTSAPITEEVEVKVVPKVEPTKPQPKAMPSKDEKDWILRYAQEYSSDEDDVEAHENEDIDVNALFADLTMKLEKQKELAAIAKVEGKRSAQSEHGKSIRQIIGQIEQLKTDPKFNEGVANQLVNDQQLLRESEKEEEVKPAPPDVSVASGSESSKDTPKEDQCDSEGSDDSEDMFAVFDSLDIEDDDEDLVSRAPQIRNYEIKGWKGVSPKELFHEWVRKNISKDNKAVKFARINSKYGYRYKITIAGRTKIEVTAEEDTNSAREGQNLCATQALFQLAKKQPLHRRLPPVFADWWRAKLEAEDAAKRKAEAEKNSPKERLIEDILQLRKDKLAEMRSSSNIPSTKTKPAPKSSKLDDEADEIEDWEKQLSEDEQETEDEEENVNNNEIPRQMNHRSTEVSEVGKRLRKDFLQRQGTSDIYAKLQPHRQALPAHEYRAQVIEAIAHNQVVIISGQTGCGKTTQVPQFVLEDALLSGFGDRCNIVCTEPRRISAISVAARVCDELGDRGPGTPKSLCGYQIRMETKRSSDTRLLYCTTGILLRRLQGDGDLGDVSHIVVDEVHERSVDSDFLLLLLRKLVARRSDVKIILMSATLDAEAMSVYYGGAPVIQIPGRTFPVEGIFVEDVIEAVHYVADDDSPYVKREQQKYNSSTVSISTRGGNSHKAHLEWTEDRAEESGLDPDVYSAETRRTVDRLDYDRINYDLIEELLIYLDSEESEYKIDGAVLIFMPGFAEIAKLHSQLLSNRVFYDSDKYIVIPLHSSVAASEQRKAFDRTPKGCRKIVIATNIAETGITIPDVVFVIDTGKVKETSYRENNRLSSLVERWISKASSKQRMGRAGRVTEGVCFRLYTRNQFSKFKTHTTPEILRVPLEELCLHILSSASQLGSPSQVLATALDPPKASAVNAAMETLLEVGAIKEKSSGQYSLTPLGNHLSNLPMDVHLGKMVVYAALSYKTPFVAPFDKRAEADQARFRLTYGESDLLTVAKVYEKWQIIASQDNNSKREAEFVRLNFLSKSVLHQIRKLKEDFRRLLSGVGFSSSNGSKNLDVNNTNDSIVRSVIVAGLYPQVAKVNPPPTLTANEPALSLNDGNSCWIHPSSALHSSQRKPRPGITQWLAFGTKVKTSKLYLRDCTLVHGAMLLFFGGAMDVDHQKRTVVIDGWIRLNVAPKTSVLFQLLRKHVDQILMDKIENPKGAKDSKIIDAVVSVLCQATKA